MPAPLSNDLRKRIMNLIEQGVKACELSKTFSVSERFIYKLKELKKETGSIEPRPLNNGRKPRLSNEQLEQIKNKLLEQPDATLEELIVEFSLPISKSALCRIINNKLNLNRKKKRCMTPLKTDQM